MRPLAPRPELAHASRRLLVLLASAGAVSCSERAAPSGSSAPSPPGERAAAMVPLEATSPERDETSAMSPAQGSPAEGSEALPLAEPPAASLAEPPPPAVPAARGGKIEITGRQLLVAGQPLLLRGVCWNPVPVGAVHPEGLDFAGFAALDIARMAELGINVVRTYEPLLDTTVLDQLAAAGIFVINSVYPWGGAPAEVVVERVRAVRTHPALLMWAVGNEWNYNGLYVGLTPADAVARLNQVTALIKAEDAEHPVATIYGELPDAATLASMPGIDVWGINAYRGLSFGDLFERWQALSGLPMFLSEYGADAYNANLPGYDPDSQAQAVEALTRELFSHASSRGGVSLGGTLFEWADEWWKDQQGSPSAQDVGGVAPGGGPYPDQVFNEEWWGIVDVARAPRPAFEALRRVYGE